MNNSEKVASYLGRHFNQTICDACLQQEIRVASSVTSLVESLNPKCFHRKRARCECCGVEAMTTTYFAEPTKEDIRAIKELNQRNYEAALKRLADKGDE